MKVRLFPMGDSSEQIGSQSLRSDDWSVRVEEFTWDKSTKGLITQHKVKPRNTTGRFIKGPVPEAWLLSASKLPGKALAVGLCLWWVAGITNKKTVRIGSELMDFWGIGRSTKSRALLALQEAGLVRIEQEAGKLGWITILEPTSEPRL